ncbi:MAG TPA: aldehyde dehydrogenase family protein [Streptosporangiaceae bacterium]|nr:aldehyde dehydrogenase family protein [Streptosporangiaceae bacterium]
MAGDRAPRLLPWVAGRFVQVTGFDDLIEPWAGRLVAQVGIAAPATVAAALSAAAQAQPQMAAMPVHERARLLRAAADIVESRAGELAREITEATGKVISHTRREARRAPWTLRAAASAAEALHPASPPPDAIPGGAGVMALIARRPVGIVAAITPFNAPLNLVAHKVAPALAVGNCVVVKPAPQAPAPALRLAEILTEAGFPAGAVNVVPGGRDTGAALLADPRVDLVSFTGGTAAGREIRAAAGLRPVLLELGGNSANLVCPDADIPLALRECLAGGFSNNGQSCNSVQRILVHRDQAGQFAGALAAQAAGLRLGDPMDESTDIGPLIHQSAAVRVEAAIAEAVAKGATLHTGGTREGAVIAPTVLSDVDHGLPLYCAEVFAPVVLVEAYDCLDDAIDAANSTPFALQAAVFTGSLATAARCFRELRAGSVIVNRSSNYRLDQLPYGGIGESGIGREGPLYAAEAMSYLKSLVIVPGSE